MSSTAKRVAREELDHVASLVKDAAQSRTYLYPFKGILYFATHNALWKPLLSKLVPTVSLGTGVTVAMFIFTYFPQAAVLALFEGPFAAISTILLVLNESSAIFNFISKGYIIDGALADTFDGGTTGIVTSGRKLKSTGDPVSRLGKMIKKPFARFAPSAVVRYLLYLPLNFIPIVGTLLFILLQGKRFGPTAHERYFILKGFTTQQRQEWIEARQGAYTSFGVPAVLLEMIPLVGIFFSFTNQVGAALWVADLEVRQKSVTQD